MGTLGDDNGGPPPGGGGLPDLPPEWGVVIIPDDPSELAPEIDEVRRELRRTARRNRRRHWLHLPPVTGRPAQDAGSLGLPLLIMAIAIIATLTSLFALAWPGPGTRPSASSPPIRLSSTAAGPTIPDLTLHSLDGTDVPLRNSLPAVFLVAEDCRCADLALETAQAVPAGVTVVTVGRTAPALPTSAPIGLRIRSLADPDGHLRSAYGGSPPVTGVTAVLVKGTGEVIKMVPNVNAVRDFEADLPRLA
jgi:hypothetical protein